MSAHYLYRIYEASGRLLYVGESKDATTRCDFHFRNAFWGDRIAKVQIRIYPDRRAALTAEARAIRTERPRFNNLGRWATRRDWDRGDFTDYLTTLLKGSVTGPSRARLHALFDLYNARFGESHPLREQTLADLAAQQVEVQRKHEEDTAKWRAQSDEIQRRDAADMHAYRMAGLITDEEIS